MKNMVKKAIIYVTNILYFKIMKKIHLLSIWNNSSILRG